MFQRLAIRLPLGLHHRRMWRQSGVEEHEGILRLMVHIGMTGQFQRPTATKTAMSFFSSHHSCLRAARGRRLVHSFRPMAKRLISRPNWWRQWPEMRMVRVPRRRLKRNCRRSTVCFLLFCASRPPAAAPHLGVSSCMVKNEGKGRKMTSFQRHKKIVVLMDILKPSQTSMAE